MWPLWNVLDTTPEPTRLVSAAKRVMAGSAGIPMSDR